VTNASSPVTSVGSALSPSPTAATMKRPQRRRLTGVLALPVVGLAGFAAAHLIQEARERWAEEAHERSTLTQRASALRAQASAWRSADEKSRTALDSALASNEWYKSRIRTVELQLDQAQQQAATTQGVNEALASHVRELSATIESLHGELAVQGYEGDALREERRVLASTVQSLAERVERLRASLAAEQRGNAEAGAALGESLARERSRVQELELQLAGMSAREAQRTQPAAVAIISQPCAAPPAKPSNTRVRGRFGDGIGKYPDFEG